MEPAATATSGRDRWVTFDCYGTLVDWMGGIASSLADLWPGEDSAALLRQYHEIEPVVEAELGGRYRDVMAESLRRLARSGGFELPPGRDDALGESLPSWPPFPETATVLGELRTRGFKLAILSNTDADFLAASLEAIGQPVDLRVVASDIGSYKPAPEHWEVFFRRSGAGRDRHVHVAASRFHDIEPCAALGLPAVWINRLGETSDVPRSRELPDLRGLPELLGELLPADR